MASASTVDTFDLEVTSLLKQSKEIIVERLGIIAELGDSSVSQCLVKYTRIYQKTEPQEHIVFFQNVYNRYKTGVLTIDRDDAWLLNGDVIIQYGDGIVDSRCDYKICLSEIYGYAADISAKEKENVSKGVPAINHKNLIRKDIIQLHLLRIFYLICKVESDKSKLGELVSSLETKLSVKRRLVPVHLTHFLPETEVKQPVNPEQGGLSNLFTFATSLMGTMGFKPPEDIKPPSESDIGAMISNILNNPKTKETMSAVLQNINPGSVSDIGKIFEGGLPGMTNVDNKDGSNK